MATINISIPQVTTAGGAYNSQPVVEGFLTASGQTINEGDVVILNAGANTIQTAATNPASALLGVAVHSSLETYGGSIQATAPINQVFGWSQANTPLFPADPAEVLVALFGNGSVVEINLATTVGWVTGGSTQAEVGTAVGLTTDATTGYWVADPGQSNKVGYITERIFGVPSFGGYGTGGNGDTSARVNIKISSSATAFGG